jgi:rRNA maturation RNase YbeY
MAVYLRVHLKRFAKRQTPLVRAAESILAAIGESQSELSVELVGDGRMRRLNRQYRGKDRTTDVLAFPMRESSNPCPAILGDVVISAPTAYLQAQEAGRSPNDEVVALLVHGVLHLCGYDHEKSEHEAARMRRRERAVLKAIGPAPRLITRSTGVKKRRG